MADEIQSDFPEAWKPEPGNKLEGTVEAIEVIDPNGQGPYPCVTIKTEDGTLRNVHAFHSVLRNSLARKRPKIGDELSISYQGKREGGAYGSYHSYAVTGGQAQEMDWNAFLPDGERQMAQNAVPIAPAPTPSQAVPQTVPADVDEDPDADLPF